MGNWDGYFSTILKNKWLLVNGENNIIYIFQWIYFLGYEMWCLQIARFTLTTAQNPKFTVYNDVKQTVFAIFAWEVT